MDSDADVPPAPRQFVTASLEVLPADEGMDLDGDGDVDNAIGAASVLLNAQLAGALADGSLILLAELAGVDSALDDTSVEVGFYLGLDTDADASNNLSGAAELGVDPRSVDDNGGPRAVGAGTIAGGVVEATVPELELNGFLALSELRIRADGKGDLSALDSGVLAGALPAGVLAQNETARGNLLDLFVSVLGAQPDIDLDGDGFETFGDSDGDGALDVCTDGDGSVVSGAGCAVDPRFADGFSLALGFSAVPCQIVAEGGGT
jgi:hypothetical protein